MPPTEPAIPLETIDRGVRIRPDIVVDMPMTVVGRYVDEAESAADTNRRWRTRQDEIDENRRLELIMKGDRDHGRRRGPRGSMEPMVLAPADDVPPEHRRANAQTALDTQVQARGTFTLDEMLATIIPGRKTPEQHAKRDELASIVAAVNVAGCRVDEIAAAIGKDRKAVQRLISRAAQLSRTV